MKAAEKLIEFLIAWVLLTTLPGGIWIAVANEVTPRNVAGSLAIGSFLVLRCIKEKD